MGKLIIFVVIIILLSLLVDFLVYLMRKRRQNENARLFYLFGEEPYLGNAVKNMHENAEMVYEYSKFGQLYNLSNLWFDIHKTELPGNKVYLMRIKDKYKVTADNCEGIVTSIVAGSKNVYVILKPDESEAPKRTWFAKITAVLYFLFIMAFLPFVTMEGISKIFDISYSDDSLYLIVGIMASCFVCFAGWNVAKNVKMWK